MDGNFAESLLKISVYDVADIIIVIPTQSKLQQFAKAGANI